MVNKPLIRPYFLGGVALGGAARIPLIVLFVLRGALLLLWICPLCLPRTSTIEYDSCLSYHMKQCDVCIVTVQGRK